MMLGVPDIVVLHGLKKNTYIILEIVTLALGLNDMKNKIPKPRVHFKDLTGTSHKNCKEIHVYDDGSIEIKLEDGSLILSSTEFYDMVTFEKKINENSFEHNYDNIISEYDDDDFGFIKAFN